MPLNHTSSYRTMYISCHWIVPHFIGSDVILSDYILHVTGSDVILLNRTSFYRITYFMSLDRTSFYWIERHSTGYIFHVIGSDVMSLDQKRHSIGPAAFWKKFVSQCASLDTYQQIWRLTCRVNIEHGLYKLDYLCSLVLRLRWTFEEALLPNLCQAHDLISLTISHNEESADVHKNRPMIVTCKEGRPKIYV